MRLYVLLAPTEGTWKACIHDGGGVLRETWSLEARRLPDARDEVTGILRWEGWDRVPGEDGLWKSVPCEGGLGASRYVAKEDGSLPVCQKRVR